MSFDDLLSRKINTKCADITKSGTGGTPELTGNDLLAAMQGCEAVYTELKTCISSSTSCNPQFLQRESEETLLTKLKYQFKQEQNYRYKKLDVKDDILYVLAKLAIYAQTQKKPNFDKLADYFECSRNTYINKYDPIFEFFYSQISKELRLINKVGNKRIERD